MAFNYYNPALHSLSDLVNAFVVSHAGLAVDHNSITLIFGDTLFGEKVPPDATSLSFYDGSLNIGIGAGLLLTSGDGAPPTFNSSEDYSVEFNDFSSDNWDEQVGQASDPDLEASINAAFAGAGEIYDLTSLTFQFTVNNPQIRGISFNVIFGSDEYPEFMDSSYVDIAGVYINGVNYALFNQSPNQPLSVLGTNQSAGNFRDNQLGQYAIEYDGLTSVLQVVAPVNQGTNSFKIAIADTGDSIYDSGVFISSFRTESFSGFGIAESIIIPPISQAEPHEDGFGNQIYEFLGGNNTLLIQGGNDLVKGGPGLTSVVLPYSLDDIVNYFFENGVLEVGGPVGITQMVDVARVALNDLLVAFDTQQGGNTWAAMSLLNAAFGNIPDAVTLSYWVAQADQSESPAHLGQLMINHYAPEGVSDADLVSLLYNNLVGFAPSAAEINSFVAMIGSGKAFGNQADLFVYAAELDMNQEQMADFIGNLIILDSSFF